MTKRKPPRQVFAGVRIIATVWKPTHDPAEALKEANANRLARAKFDQAMATDDLVIRHAMLEPVEDDGTAGAALLRYACDVLEAKRREQVLQANNESRVSTRDINSRRYCAVANTIRAGDPSLTPWGVARATGKKLGVSPKTISRALKRRAASAKN